MKNRTNKSVIASCALICILIIIVLYTTSKSSQQSQQEITPSVVTTATIPDTQVQPKASSTKTYPVGSYKVFVEQMGGVGSIIPPKISVYNANAGSDLKPVEDYVFYKFYAQKKSEDTLSINCANPDMYYPIEIKSVSDSNLWIPPNPDNDPKLDTSISMYLEKYTNDLSFVCMHR